MSSKCLRVHDELVVCNGLGNAIKLGAIESGIELHPVPGRLTWWFRPGVSNLPSFEFCPFCGTRIMFP